MPGAYLWGWDATTSKWVKVQVDTDGILQVEPISKIVDADGDTKVDTEEAADEDKVRMDVAGVEAFYLSDVGILTLAKQSAIRAYLATADQTISHNSVTKVTLNAESYDVLNEFDPITNHRFTATEAGKYIVTVCVYWDVTVGDKQYQARIHKNGVAVAFMSMHSAVTIDVTPFCATTLDLAAGDWIELFAYHYAGVNQDVKYVGGFTILAVTKIA